MPWQERLEKNFDQMCVKGPLISYRKFVTNIVHLYKNVVINYIFYSQYYLLNVLIAIS